MQNTLRAPQILMLLLLATAVLLPGMTSLPPLDRDESRFVQASKQMQESGDYVDIRFQDVPRHKKPAGIYWLQSAAASFDGGPEAAIWAYRVPSLLAAIGAVLITALIAAHLFGASIGFAAGLVISAVFGLGLEARMAKTDATLLLSVMGTAYALARLYAPHSATKDRLAPWIFWVALGAGVLIKGPITPMVAGLTMLALSAWDRNLMLFRKLLAPLPILAFLALALPWYVAIYLQTDGAFFTEAVGKDMLGKVASGQESHGAPPGYYIGIFALAFFPFAFPAITALPHVFAARRETAIKFLIAWAVPSWILFELMPTKLPHYVLPMFPAIAILAAWAAYTVELKRSAFTRIVLVFTTIIGVVLCVGLIGAPFYAATSMPGGEHVIYPVISGLLVGLGAIVFLHTCTHVFRFQAQGEAIRHFWLAGALVLAPSFYGLAPAMSPMWISPRIVSAMQSDAACDKPLLAASGFHEPSLVFLAGTETHLTSAEGAAAHLASGLCTYALVEAADTEKFEQALTLPVQKVATIKGNNYSRGDNLTLDLYKATAE